MRKAENYRREFELKFDASDAQLRRLRSKRVIKEINVGRASNKKLRSIYFDTQEHLLRANGVSLRVRLIGGTWVQTLKFDHQFKSGISKPIEIEHEVSNAKPDTSLLQAKDLPTDLWQVLKQADLKPVFETIISRTTRDLSIGDGSRVELAFDTGEACAGNVTVPINEIELELKSGTSAAVYQVAQKLIQSEPMRFSDCTKAERGYRAANGEAAELYMPAAHVLPRLSKKSSAEDVLRALLRACHAQISHNWRVMTLSAHPEGTHQFRIGLRRLRSILDGFGASIEERALAALQIDAKKLANLAGTLHDADVLIEDTVDPVAQANPGQPQLLALSSALRSEQEGACKRVLAELMDGRVEKFLLQLAEFQGGKQLLLSKNTKGTPSAKTIARAELSKSWRRVQRYGKRIKDLEIDERHAMRRALKKFRYQFEAFSPLFPRRNAKPLHNRLRTLQDTFGYLNDVAMAEQLLELEFGKANDERSLNGAAFFVLGWHAARAEESWKSAQERWIFLRQAKKAWNN